MGLKSKGALVAERDPDFVMCSPPVDVTRVFFGARISSRMTKKTLRRVALPYLTIHKLHGMTSVTHAIRLGSFCLASGFDSSGTTSRFASTA